MEFDFVYQIPYASSGRGLLQSMNVGKIVDASETHAASVFSVEVCKGLLLAQPRH
jgi:hypothetical protein